MSTWKPNEKFKGKNYNKNFLKQICFSYALWILILWLICQSVFAQKAPVTPQTDMLGWAQEKGLINKKIRNPPRIAPKTLDDEQRAMLTEAPRLFPYMDSMHLQSNRGQLFWMDETRIIASVRQLGDWQMSDGEQPKVVVLHTDTDILEETSYRGDLSCYAPERMVLVQLPNTEVSVGAFRGGLHNLVTGVSTYRVLAGKFGEVLRHEEYIENRDNRTQFNAFDCKAYKERAPWPSGEGYFIFQLHEGDGIYGYRLDVRKPRRVIFDTKGLISFVFPEGLGANAFNFDDIQYNSTLKKYYLPTTDFIGDTSKGSAASGLSVSFSSNGKDFQTHALPPLMLNMLDQMTVRWGKYYTAIGIVYKAIHSYRSDPFQGLYIHSSEKTYRFFNTKADVLAVSPSGCLMSTRSAVKDATETKPVLEFRHRIFNFCKEKTK